MKVETAWVAPPQAIGGLDHLGTQAPCILIYSQLLPGITNVTDRARYYSFYPWLIWSFDQRYPDATAENFVEFYRRADCLLTLIAERHARTTDNNHERHGAAMVGRNQLLPALDRLQGEGRLRLSDYTASDSPTRYFKNQLGGLRQYYAGTLSDLKLIDASAKPWIKYTIEHGEPLANAVDTTVLADRFWEVVESDEVELADLDELDAFCPCRLAQSGEECGRLTDLYFDRQGQYDQEGVQRRHSLGVLLHLVDSLAALGDDYDLNEWVFRASTYTATLPGNRPWAIPEALRPTVGWWSIYQRNDMLSVACQAILALSLKELQPQDWTKKQHFQSVEEFATAFSRNADLVKSLKQWGPQTFGDLVQALKGDAPDLEDWEQDLHEIQLAYDLPFSWGRGDKASDILLQAIRVLALLALRDDPEQTPYGTLAITSDALRDYPINLVSFRERVAKWHDMPLEDFVADLAAWCMNTHLRVALRKLRQTGRSSFHLRPSEQGLEVVGDIPPPAPTTPRFRQATQILRDIGALNRADIAVPGSVTVLSESGRQLLEASSV